MLFFGKVLPVVGELHFVGTKVEFGQGFEGEGERNIDGWLGVVLLPGCSELSFCCFIDRPFFFLGVVAHAFAVDSFGYACCTEFFNGDLFGGCKAGVEPSYGNDAVAGFNDMKVAAFGGAVASAFAQMVAFECVVVYRCNRGNPEGV